jgi:hypothetical protein
MLKKYLKRNWIWLVLIGILVAGVIVRLKDFYVLPVDGHPMRQTDTECVSYFIAKGQANFLYPKSCLMRPVSNTNGYFFLEVPFYELAIAASYKIFGFYPFAARIVNLILFLVGGLALFGFMKKWWNKGTALFSVLVFSFVPGSIFFVGHALHPDAMAVSFILVALFFGWKYRENGKILNLILSGLFLGISVASRPFGLICLPLLGYFLYLRKSKIKDYLILAVLSISFYGWWWWRTKNLGIDMSWENWVLAGRDKLFHIATLKNLIWKNVIGETMGKVVSGLAGLGLIVSLIKKDKRIIPLILWMLGVVVYWLIVPDGNVTHQYYADVYIPLFVILASIGLSWLWSKNKILTIILTVGLIYNGIRTSNYHYGNQAGGEIEIQIAQDIDKAIPEGKKIIYLANDDSVPLSLSHRQGWMLGEWPTDVAVHIWAFMEMRNYKFDYIVEPKNRTDITTDEWNIIKQNYPLVGEMGTIRIYKYR